MESSERSPETSDERKIIWPVGILGILLFVTGIGAMVQSEIRPIYHAFQSRDWEEIDAEIVLSEFGPSEISVLGFLIVTAGGAFCIMMGFGNHERYDQ